MSADQIIRNHFMSCWELRVLSKTEQTTPQLDPPLVLCFETTGTNRLSFLSPPVQTTLTASVHVGDGSPAQTERHRLRQKEQEWESGSEWGSWKSVTELQERASWTSRDHLAPSEWFTWLGRHGCHGMCYLNSSLFLKLSLPLDVELKEELSVGSGILHHTRVSNMNRLLSNAILMKRHRKFSNLKYVQGRLFVWYILDQRTSE